MKSNQVKQSGSGSDAEVGESCIETYFKNANWLAMPYLTNQEHINTLSEYTVDNNILAEGQAVISLFIFLKDNFKMFLTEKSLTLRNNTSFVYYIVTTVAFCIPVSALGLFLHPSRTERLLPPASSYAHSVNPPTSLDDSSNPLTSVHHSSNHSMVTHARKEIFITASQVLEEDELIRQKLRELRGLFRLGLRGGGGPFLANPNPIDIPSSSKSSSAIETRKAFPQGGKRMLASENTPKAPRLPSLSPPSSISRIRTGNLSTSVDHSSNQSWLPSKTNLSAFLGVHHLVEGRSAILPVQALKPVGDYSDYKNHEYENLEITQELKWKSTILDETTKREVGKGMARIVENLWDKRDKLIHKRNNSTKASTEFIDRDIKNLEKKIRFEREQLEDHLGNAFNSDIVTLMIRRTPKDSSHGDATLNFQMYDPDFLSTEQKDITGNNLAQHLREFIEGIELGTNLPSEIKQCEQIQETTLVGCFDVNKARTKTVTTLYDKIEKKNKIAWLPRKIQCIDPRYKDDMVKSQPTDVDIFVLEKLKPKAKFRKEPQAKVRKTPKAKVQETPKAKGLEMPKAKVRKMRGKL